MLREELIVKFKTVALLHPGNMGVTIGAAAAAGGEWKGDRSKFWK